MSNNHILYSFRRCPYAMRARMALLKAEINPELREVDFKNKPEHLLEISPKGTVPVLQLEDGRVIEESLEIMIWALMMNDPDGWLSPDDEVLTFLIDRNDGPFKHALDRHKYPNRYPDEDCSEAFDAGAAVLEDLNRRIQEFGHLAADHTTLADIAIFPFVRQFVNTDKERFASLGLTALSNWLERYITSDLFENIMEKHDPWQPGDPETYLKAA